MKIGLKHVFVDWCGIEAGFGTGWPGSREPLFTPSGVRIAVHRPALECEPVFMPEMPWEGFSVNGYATFLEDGGRIRCWYECMPALSMDDMTCLLAYAESDDGVQWKRPVLNVFEFNGSKRNNIVKNLHGASVFKDPAAPASERYKLIFAKYYRNASDGVWCRICAATSPDGIVWNDLPEPILVNPADTQSIACRDGESGKYVLYTRQTYAWEKRLNPRRRAISRCETGDFAHWPEPEMVLANDPADPPDWDYYTSGYTQWPGADAAHLMFVEMYHRTMDTFDIHLAASRNGKLWHRPMGREPWMPLRPAESFNERMLLMTSGIVRADGGRWAQYVTCLRNGHNDPLEDYVLPAGGYWRSLIREDGYMSLAADGHGECWTVPFVMEGGSLQVNAAVPYAGSLRFGIVDAATGEPLEGYDLQACGPLDGNGLWRTVRWNGNERLEGISGRNVRLHIRLFKSDLYAFRFADKAENQ